MKTVILKVGNLAILQDAAGRECEVVTGYRPGGPYESIRECESLSEAVVAFGDIFGLRIQRWAKRKEEQDGTSSQDGEKV